MIMETKLNDNEVREVAKMQIKTDTYESFMSATHAKIVAKHTDLNYLLFDGTMLTKEMNEIWRFVKQTIKEGKENKE